MADAERPTTPVRATEMTRDERTEAQVYRGLRLDLQKDR